MRTLLLALFAAFVFVGCDASAPEAVTADASSNPIAGPTTSGYNCQTTYFNDSENPALAWSVVGKGYRVSSSAWSITVQATGDADGTSNHVVKIRTSAGIWSHFVQHTTTSCSGGGPILE